MTVAIAYLDIQLTIGLVLYLILYRKRLQLGNGGLVNHSVGYGGGLHGLYQRAEVDVLYHTSVFSEAFIFYTL